MERRNFLRTVVIGSGTGAGLAALERQKKQAAKLEWPKVEWRVEGFYCPTCAIGLETLLQRNEAIGSVTAEYPSGRVRIGYDAAKITPATIAALIEEAGFKVSRPS